MNRSLRALIFCVTLQCTSLLYTTEGLGIHTDVHDRAFVQCNNKNILQDIYHYLKCIFKPVEDVVQNIPDQFEHHEQHEKDACCVRMFKNYELCQDEEHYLQKRTLITNNALARFCNHQGSPQKLPRIAACFSGGGFRSMILTLGFLAGAEETGLLDCMTYIAGLSGSTWAIAPWIASGKRLMDITQDMRHQTHVGLNHIITEQDSMKEVGETIVRKIKHDQLISLIDIYGPLLANTLLGQLGDKRLSTTLSESHKCVANGTLPMPIYTAINVHTKPYDWFEITPFEVGSAYLKAGVPTWAYGRKFKNGISTNVAPEQTLGYMMGIFGSAFEINAQELLYHSVEMMKDIKNPIPGLYHKLRDCFNQLVHRSIMDDMRMFPSHLRNFTYKMDESPTKDQKMISLVDAGIDFNLPVPPLLHQGRGIDIIIIYDASANVKNAPELKKAETYAREHNYSFPAINYAGIEKKFVSVFEKLDDPNCPTIIYFPLIKNPTYSSWFDPEKCIESDYCGTFNFTYQDHQFNELFGLATYTIKEQTDVIRSVINNRMHRDARSEHKAAEL